MSLLLPLQSRLSFLLAPRFLVCVPPLIVLDVERRIFPTLISLRFVLLAKKGVRVACPVPSQPRYRGVALCPLPQCRLKMLMLSFRSFKFPMLVMRSRSLTLDVLQIFSLRRPQAFVLLLALVMTRSLSLGIMKMLLRCPWTPV